MKSLDCDFSPMKEALKKDIRHLILALQRSLKQIEGGEDELFNGLQSIRENVLNIEMKVATFYLNCYLAPFTEEYEVLSASIQKMAKVKHGGLIVVQREDSLGELVKEGVAIHAELTEALLASIFYPGNPLHDGAVIINHNHIVSAANILPLSEESLRNLSYGTRHRAAIGLTERCDALVLVVSEESGHVSFSYGGKLHPITM